MEAKKNVENLVREAERGRAEVYRPPGEYRSQYELDDAFFHEVSHLDQALIAKIEKGDYVDLHKLLPKEKILHDEGKIQLVHHEGNTFFVPVMEKDTPTINSIRKWEQGFEVYAITYVRANP